MFRLSILLCSILVTSFIKLSGQCTNGSENECSCTTADILCSVNELDGYTSALDPFQHENDGPTPICNTSQTETNNPSWFAFIAWCEDIEMEVELSNCSSSGGFTGAQIAVFSNCNYNCVDFNNGCNGGNVLDLELDDLNIGDTYYFMIDGCAGVVCDYTISVSPDDCDEEITDWDEDLIGETSVCVGDEIEYIAEDVDGASLFHWFIDGSEEDQTEDPEIEILWDTEGTYTLCVDASNECIPVEDDQGDNPPGADELCVEIFVAAPNAGIITADPQILCPTEDSEVEVTGYNDDDDYTEVLIIVDPNGEVIEVLEDEDMTEVSIDECGIVKVYSLNFGESEGVPIPSEGDSYNGSDCVTFCCDEACLQIFFQDNEDPEFDDPPQDITVSCYDLIPEMEDLLAIDNCSPDEMVEGEESGDADICEGGEIEREWEFEDGCGNMVTHVQVITVEAPEEPDYDMFPSDMTIECEDDLPDAIDLNYTNNGSGDCLIEGIVEPEIEGEEDPCGATVTYIWEFTDDCGNELYHEQVIEILPADEAEFIDPPSSVMVYCDGDIPDPVDLDYTNNMSGDCEIAGTIEAEIEGEFNLCGAMVEYVWEFEDDCGNLLEYTQVIFVDPAEPAEWVNPPGNMTISCEDPEPDAIDLEYTNGVSGDCEISGFVEPEVDGEYNICGSTIEYTWTFEDDCENEITHFQTITVEPVEEAEFINPPGDMTFSCEEFSSFEFEDLEYSNGLEDACEISGEISPEIDDQTNGYCGGFLLAEWEFEDDCERVITHFQTITVEEAPKAEYLSTPGNITVECDEIPDDFPALEYTNDADGDCLIEGEQDPDVDPNIDECGGTIIVEWEFEDDCGRQTFHQQIITVNPAQVAEFIDPPEDLTLSCEEFDDFEPEELEYTNNQDGECEIAGEESAEEEGSIDECGGTITYVWEFTDACGRTITHEQMVTVEPAPMAEFVDVPDDVTLDCDEFDDDLPELEYTNDASGVCEIEGEVTAIESGFVDECGGEVEYTWTFTDACNRTITATQTIEVLPAPEPEFDDPPEDITIDCDEDVPDPDELEYENGEDDICEIAGFVDATISIEDNIYTYVWEFTNDCTDNTITHTQVLTKLFPVEWDTDEFEFTICVGDEFDLSLIDLIDINMTDPEITFHDDLPPRSNNEIDPEIILDDFEEEFYIVGTNEYGCFAAATIFIFGDESAVAGDDEEGEICIDEGVLDLFFYLDGSADPFGDFTQIDGPELEFVDASEINISNAEAGTYVFEYIIISDNGCQDEAILEMELFPALELELISIECTPDGNTYTVIIEASETYEIDPDPGRITDRTGTQITISDIDIDEDLFLEVEENDCEQEYLFNHPVCDCPQVDPPSSNGDPRICEGEPTPELSVTVGPDNTANWYDSAIGGTQLATGTLSFTPTETLPGIYNYYVEAENTIQPGCLSATRTLVTLEIAPQPEVIDGFVNYCDEDQTGIVTLQQNEIELVAFNNLQNLTASYYISLNDLQSQSNAISFPLEWNSANNNILYAQLTNSAGCSKSIEIEIRVNELPELTLTPVTESCFGQGDGQINIDVQNGQAPYEVVFRGETLTDLNITNLEPGNYTVSAIDALGCSSQAMITLTAGPTLEIIDLVILCEDNGTSTDAEDDFYNVSFIVNSSDGSQGDFEIVIQPSGDTESGSYGTLVNLQLPADNSETSLSITDNTFGCQLSQDLGELKPCSSDCSITLITLEYNCDGNGTDTDPTDDTYNFEINASVVNGSAAQTYNIYIDNVLSFSFSYDALNTFTLPANGSSVNIRIEDSQFDVCFISEVTEVLNPCSDACLLDFDILSITCDNAGTQDSNDDDFFTAEIIVSGLNTSTGYSTDLGQDGTYGEILIVNGLISDGDIVLNVIDNDDNTCTTVIPIPAPEPCSQPCELGFSLLNITDCNDNGTPTDPNDDSYVIQLNVEVLDGDSDRLFIEDDRNNNYGPFPYNTLIELGPFPADGTITNYQITDLINGSCLLEFDASQLSCSDLCVLEVQIVNIECNNNGTEDTSDDDLFNVEIIVLGENTSDNFIIDGLNLTGSYNVPLIINDLLISDGEFTVLVTDEVDVTCQSELEINPPAPCSSPCDVVLNSLEILDCNDNQTGTINDDDFFEIRIDVESILGTGGDYMLRDDSGNTYGPFNYNISTTVGPFPSDGSTIILTLFDETNGSCFLEFDISNNPCSECPQTIGIIAPETELDCETTEVSIELDASETPDNILWTDPAGTTFTTEEIEADKPGTYTVEVTFADGCSLTDNVEITLDGDLPVSNLGPDQQLDCEITSLTLTTDNSNLTNNTLIEWVDENGDVISNDPEFIVDAAGTYGLLLTDTVSLCSSEIDFITIEQNSNVPSAVILADPGNIFDCFIETINLSPEMEDNTVYSWLINGQEVTDQSIDVNEPNEITLIAIDTISNCENEGTIVLEDLTAFPLINLGPISDIDCDGNISCFTAESPASQNVSYLWFDGAGNQVGEGQEYCTSVPGSFTVEVTDLDNDCVNNETFSIDEATTAEVVLPAQVNLSLTDEFTLLPEINIPASQILSILWETEAELSCYDCLNPTILSFEDNALVTLTIVTIDNCPTLVQTVLILDSKPKVYIPNVINTDEDDGFTIYTNEAVNEVLELRIYDRWGNLMFVNENFAPNVPEFGWDGTYNGKQIEQGVYVYYVSYELNGLLQIEAGDLTLFR